MTQSSLAARSDQETGGAGELRFLTCGSVDDGKSTLIGRLLYESKLLYADHLAALEADSKRVGTRGEELDFALLCDGLAAEREQGITIDVAYRFFTTERRRFIVADTPGHEQYTRNMVTGASNAEAAVVLLDARTGVLSQTRRHARLLALLGIRHVALAVNKLDLVDYSQDRFADICAQFAEFAEGVGIDEVTCVPVSAVHGDNVVAPSAATPWYSGPSLLEWLESVEPAGAGTGASRFLVQWVNRPHSGFRGYSGQVVRGSVSQGDPLQVVPGGNGSTVQRIVTMDGDVEMASTGMAVTIVLSDDIDVSRGDVLAAADEPAPAADSFQAHLVWMDEHEMLPGRQYLAKFGSRTVGLTIQSPKYRIDIDSGGHEAARTLARDEIAVANVHVDSVLAYEPYAVTPELGSFIVLDRLSNNTVGAGMIDFALRRSANVAWQSVTVDKSARAARNGHQPCVVWFTGLSGAGKSTVADLVEKALHAQGRHTFLLDGDNIRHGLNKDLGFTDADRVENIRRIGEVGTLMADAGLIVLVSFISPFRAERELARGLVQEGEFCEVHVDAPLADAEQRDPKGLYAKARRGELINFTGIDSPYEPPEQPEVWLDTTVMSAEEAAESVLTRLEEMGVLPQR